MKLMRKLKLSFKNLLSTTNTNDILFALIALFSAIQIKNKLTPLLSSILLAVLFIGYSIQHNWFYSICTALILGFILVTFTSTGREGFEAENKEKTTIKKNLAQHDITDVYDSKLVPDVSKPKDSDITDIVKSTDTNLQADDDLNTWQSSKDKSTNASKTYNTNTELQNNNAQIDDFTIDTKATFLDNLNSLTKQQIQGLNTDTKELIETQKQLIETLKNMGPSLINGKSILDNFKQYFGNQADLGIMLKNTMK